MLANVSVFELGSCQVSLLIIKKQFDCLGPNRFYLTLNTVIYQLSLSVTTVSNLLRLSLLFVLFSLPYCARSRHIIFTIKMLTNWRRSTSTEINIDRSAQTIAVVYYKVVVTVAIQMKFLKFTTSYLHQPFPLYACSHSQSGLT